MTRVKPTNEVPNCQTCLGSGDAPTRAFGSGEPDPCGDCNGTGKWVPFAECPCLERCGVRAAKLSVRSGHARGCTCRSCLGRRNRAKGQRTQARMHRRLGGTGFTPQHEEGAVGYELTVWLIPEAKTGKQVPRKLASSIESDWFRRALRQSERAIPHGSTAMPAVYFELPGSSGGWLLMPVPATLDKAERTG